MRPGTRPILSASHTLWRICRPCSGGCARAAAGWRWRRATTASPSVRTLEALGVAAAIDAMVCADDGVAVKPAPDMVIHLCAIVGVAPARTAVVGDSPADLRMGRAAGAGLVVAVLTGVGARADLEPLADVVAGSVEALVGG